MWSWQVVDAFAAVRVERNWFNSLSEELFVEDIQHFKEG